MREQTGIGPTDLPEPGLQGVGLEGQAEVEQGGQAEVGLGGQAEVGLGGQAEVGLGQGVEGPEEISEAEGEEVVHSEVIDSGKASNIFKLT